MNTMPCQPLLIESSPVPSTESFDPGDNFNPTENSAAAGSVKKKHRRVEYLPLPCRTVLNRCTGRRAPFDWTVNPYRGCEFGCVYCFARYTHAFMDRRGAGDWETKVYVKQDAAETLREDLLRLADSPGPIALGTATDLYQPAERRFGITRSVLETFCEFQGLHLGLTTKSNLVTRDVDVLKDVSKRHDLRVNISITTPNRRLSKRLEPRAPSLDKRLNALRKLCDANIPAGVFIMPVLPRLTDGLQDLEELIARAAANGARWVGTQPLWLTSAARRPFYSFLRRYAPDLLDRYRHCYDRHMDAPAVYRKWLMERVGLLRKKHGIPDKLVSGCSEEKRSKTWVQPDLFSLDRVD